MKYAAEKKFFPDFESIDDHDMCPCDWYDAEEKKIPGIIIAVDTESGDVWTHRTNEHGYIFEGVNKESGQVERFQGSMNYHNDIRIAVEIKKYPAPLTWKKVEIDETVVMEVEGGVD